MTTEVIINLINERKDEECHYDSMTSTITTYWDHEVIEVRRNWYEEYWSNWHDEQPNVSMNNPMSVTNWDYDYWS